MHCAQCGRLLPAANAICDVCDRELSASLRDALHAPFNEGDYICPQCLQHFGQHITVLYPPNAPWYRPQSRQSACPHCKTAITWLKLPRPSTRALRWHGLAYLSALWPTALLFFDGKQFFHPYLATVLTFCTYMFTLVQGRKTHMALTPPDDNPGQWMLLSEAKALQRHTFGRLPVPLLLLIWMAVFIGLMTLLPLTVMACLSAMLAAFSVFAGMMAWRIAHQAITSGHTPPQSAPMSLR